MKRISALFLMLSVLFLTPAQVQAVVPVEVFAEYDHATQTLTLHFTNAISGLSSTAVINGFPRDRVITDEMTVTSQGVLFRGPVDRRVLLASPDGQITPHPFIPQQTADLVDVDWVLSPDRRSIAWVEVFPAADTWVSNAYIADIEGTSITPLPPAPPTAAAPFRRMMPVALTNDRSLFFYDAAAPIENRSLTDYFLDYEDLHVYVAASGRFQQLPGEAGCACGAGVGNNGRSFLRLNRSGAGFDLSWWNLDSNAEQVIPAGEPGFAQAGDFFVPETYPFAFYSQAQNLEDPTIDAQFALMFVNLGTHSQSMLIGPSAQRFKVMAVIDSGASIVMVDVYGGSTYKMSLNGGEPQLVAENMWLGTLFLE